MSKKAEKTSALPPSTPFGIALAVRRNQAPVESLTPAARILFNDKGMSTDALATYVEERKAPVKNKDFGRRRMTYKRG